MKTTAHAIVAIFAAIALAAEPATQNSTMSAVCAREAGGPEVLKIEQIPKPTPAASELLVKVYAAGVNPVDWRMRQGGAGRRGGQPYIPGFDVSGVVEQVGTGVTKFKSGDAVFAMLGLNRGGGYAEYAIVKESEAAMKPAKLSHVEAAAVPLAALTAWQALIDTAKVEKGQTVLIHGGAGGVGSFAVQIAKWKGARVIATASKENHEFLRQIGADETIDYHTQKFSDVAKDVDVVLDTVGGQTQADSWAVMKKGGILVSIVGRPAADKAREAGVRGEGILVRSSSDELAQIAKLIDDGSIKPVVTYTFSLSDAAKAQEQSETHHTRGKIVLKVAE
ncbi:MAG TPA: NADP-dependent oxidoreductase [Tepidisphaeraceae bacterium]